MFGSDLRPTPSPSHPETTAKGACRFRTPAGHRARLRYPVIAAGPMKALGSEVSPQRARAPQAGTKRKLYDSSYDVKR